MDSYWDGNGPHPVKYENESAGFPYCTENGLNFSTGGAAYSEDDAEYAPGRRTKTSRQDPLSHRIIEKRRRDRMNSCLADLSRLIPPQYQRKGRGRIEKTEIIEMSIRYMKYLQNQEEINYKHGYEECLQQATKFLYNSHRELCYQLVEYLKEHCNDGFKSDYMKRHYNIDAVSASSGSPQAHAFQPTSTLSQLKEMLATSDVEHSNNSNDHNDVKDLSFRHQPPVIQTTAPPIVHHESSQDFDSSRASSVHHHENGGVHYTHASPHESVLRSVRVRKFSESSHDTEHNNNSYKYKNYIQQKFLHEDEHLHSVENGHKSPASDGVPATSSELPAAMKKRKMSPDVEAKEGTEPITNGASDIKQEIASNPSPVFGEKPIHNLSAAHERHPPSTQSHPSVPIFALHTQGLFYVPLNVDYEALIPYLGGFDLFDKNIRLAPPLHPVNINVHFLCPRATKMPVCLSSRPKIEHHW